MEESDAGPVYEGSETGVACCSKGQLSALQSPNPPFGSLSTDYLYKRNSRFCNDSSLGVGESNASPVHEGSETGVSCGVNGKLYDLKSPNPVNGSSVQEERQVLQ